MSGPSRVAIIGGGFSGALQAVNLLRHDGPRAVLIERRPEVGRGTAYSTPHPAHLLNVPANNMSALPDDPGHFLRWLDAHSLGGGGPFVPRATYGRYLSELVEETRRRAPNRLEIVQGNARSLDLADGVQIKLHDGRRIEADAAVLAMGNLPPPAPDHLDPAALATCYVSDPWAPSSGSGLDSDDHVLILGTGLTMIDAVLLLQAQGFHGRITAISRRGLIPRMQAHPISHARLSEKPAGEVSRLLRRFRIRARAIGWQTAIDELRPFTQAMWQAATLDQKRRFLRHLRPWWDVHRHRLAPPIAQQIRFLRSVGTLKVAAGRILAFAPRRGSVEVSWRPRGSGDVQRLLANRIINCTGPESDPSRSTEPLLLDLLSGGIVVSDILGLGLAVNSQGMLLRADGTPSRSLFALGPMTRGTFWEITAVPDIRVQAWRIARYISNAHWIGWEGL